MLGRDVGVIRVADVGDEKNLVAVAGDGGLATIGLERLLLLGELLGLGAVVSEVVVVGVHQDAAAGAVDDDHVAALDVLGAVRDGEHGGNLERAGDDGGVGRAAAGLGDDAGHVVLVDVSRHRGGELVDDHDGVLGQRGEVDDLLAQQVGEKPGLDVGDVGRALAEELVLHVGEHVVVHVIGLGDGLLGAHAGLDGAVDHLLDALVLGKLDVGAHDGGGLLAHGLRHALDLGVGLLDELGDGGGVALLLVAGVIRLVRSEAQVGLNGHARDADPDAVRCVNSLVHVLPHPSGRKRPS